MISKVRSHVRGSLLLLSIVAVAVAGCGGSAATKAPGGGGGGNNATNANGGGGTVDISQAGKKLSSINSYKFRMEMAGGSFDALSGLAGDGGAFIMTGTVVMKPVKSAAVEWAGFKVVEIGDKSYVNLGGDTWTEDDSSTNMADSFSPEKMFGSYSSFGWKSAGEGQKNGVTALHYTIDASEMNSYASALGVKGAAQWAVEMWIAKDGGYPVNMTMTAKQDTKYAFKFVMDITDINSPSNKVEKPNVAP